MNNFSSVYESGQLNIWSTSSVNHIDNVTENLMSNDMYENYIIIHKNETSIFLSILVFSVYIITMLSSFIGNTIAICIFLRKRKKFGIKYRTTMKPFTSTEKQVDPHSENYLQSFKNRHVDGNYSSSASDYDHNNLLKKNLDNSIEKAPKHLHHIMRNTCQKQTFYMNGAFNYYLASLGISDLFMGLFCIPFTFTQIYLHHWPFPDLMCPIVVYVQLVMVTASSLTNTVISLNRLFGIISPFRFDHWPSRHQKSLTICIIISIWAISFSGSTVQLFATRTQRQGQNTNPLEQKEGYSAGRKLCQESWDGDDYKRSIYTVVLFLVIYIIPLGIQTSTYGYISFRLWNRKTPGESIKGVEDMRIKEKKRIIKMLAFIVAMFGICWLPSHLFFLLQDFSTLFRNMPEHTTRLVYGMCHWIAMSNSFVNPIIYLIMSRSFRSIRKSCLVTEELTTKNNIARAK
ncbi:putative neuropeptide receptor [Schistosoma mansoni]|uniref:putative neuropeptide receptor n=1 Tax=Schistosoma mansoni TaxID=6183 RepID=UPI0001A628BD|nr:putative neuropeptide receptor [Schistosoma mansoni]|eukprot:XP_018654664.1 putative neuropeptide receptor [Schistosoma mansoni]